MLSGVGAYSSHIGNSYSRAADAIEKLASGKRINRASDDAAGLAVAEKLDSKYRGEKIQSRNTQDEISMRQTYEGGLSIATDILQRMREISLQAANGTLTDSDRAMLSFEYEQMRGALTDTYNRTEFNTKPLRLDGRVDFNQTDIDSLSALDSRDAASRSLSEIDSMLTKVVSTRASYGSDISALEKKMEFHDTYARNLIEAYSRIMDTDYAAMVTELTSAQLQAQVSTQMTQAANSMAGTVIDLIA